MSIDFDRINQAVLASLKGVVSSWIPGGRFEGDEYVVKNPMRKDDHAGSFKINTSTGNWDDFGDPSDYARINTIIAVSQAIDEGEVLTIGDVTATNAWTGWGGERILYPGADINNRVNLWGRSRNGETLFV